MDITLDEQIQALQYITKTRLFSNELNDKLLSAITILQKAKENEWISVKTKLPEGGVDVVGLFPSGSKQIVHWAVGFKCFCMIKNDGDRSGDYSVRADEVTHWLPLPTFENKQTDKLKGE